jgi:REP-associated tyrosine transposase
MLVLRGQAAGPVTPPFGHLLTDHIDALRAATRLTRTRHPFTIDAMVVLPDHIHAVWTLPPGDADFSLRWRLIKVDFAKAVPIPSREGRCALRAANAVFGNSGNT